MMEFDFYVSGKMTGLPNYNHEAFNAAAKLLRDKGYRVFNPAENDAGSTDKPREFYLKADIEGLLQCKMVYLLNGWETSAGAKLEVDIAKELKLKIVTEDFKELKEETILEEADRIVSSDRGNAYGHPFDDFTKIGRIWGAIIGVPDIAPEKIGLCMIGVKLSREAHKHKRDNLVDCVGYAKTVKLIMDRKETDAQTKKDFADIMEKTSRAIDFYNLKNSSFAEELKLRDKQCAEKIMASRVSYELVD